MEKFEHYQKTQMRLMKTAMAYSKAIFEHGPLNSGREISNLKDAAEEFDAAVRKLG